MAKKIVLLVVITAVIIAAALFLYRYRIIQYSADIFIRKSLPDYIRIDKINFDARGSKVTASGFKILNPPDFSNPYLVEIAEVSCRYKLKGKDITGGFEIYEPAFKKLLLNIERLGDGRLNLGLMGDRLKKDAAPTSETSGEPAEKPASAEKSLKFSSIVKLPDKFSVKDGKIVFVDRFNLAEPHVITFEKINAGLLLKLDEGYSRILGLSSEGVGNVNGRNSEIINWNISLDPTTPKLTMSSRFDVSNIEIRPFWPYYDGYSPLVFTGGTFSGLLIFDFNNGSIGSSNEIHLQNIKFYVKPGYENAQFWESTVPELVKYFTSPYGEIIFDFKIKGDMENPKFYLGPISKQALTSMAVDKISDVIESMSKPNEHGPARTDMDKAKDYIELFKGLVNKK